LKPFKLQYSAYPDQFGGHAYSVKLNVQMALTNPNAPRTKRFEAIIDSGATRCLFHSSLADFLGIQRTACRVERTMGIGGVEDSYLHDVLLFVPGGPVTITAGFKDNLPVAGLLGITGFFEYFQILFDTPAKICELTRLYQA
jgi:hypothetical protein